MSYSILIDFEARSLLPLTGKDAVGTWRYAEHYSTEVLCVAYIVRDENRKLIARGVWIRGDESPPGFFAYMTGDFTMKALNAPFEMAIWDLLCVPRMGWPAAPLNRWDCIMARALVQAYPGGLEDLGTAMGLRIQKDMEGRKLMLTMCKPLKQKRKRKKAGVIEWKEDDESMQRLAKYCLADVDTADLADAQLRPLLFSERRLWLLDQKINQRGFNIDYNSAVAANEMIDAEAIRFNEEITDASGGVITKPTQDQRIKKWMTELGYPIPNMQAETVGNWLDRSDLPDYIWRVLEIRSLANGVAIKKIKAMLRMRTADGTIKHAFAFHDPKTGRWGSKGVQAHNFPREQLETDSEVFFTILNQRNFGLIDFVYGDCMKTLTKCLRNFIIPRPGYVFKVGDFSSVESIVLNVRAGAAKKVAMYRNGIDIYKHSITNLYGMKVNEVTKSERSEGKVIELASGYQGSVGALATFCRGYGIPMVPLGTEGNFLMNGRNALELVQKWRKANPEIVAFWYATERAATQAVLTGKIQECNGIKWGLWKDVAGRRYLCALLPSGRYLYYNQPRVEKVGRYYKLSIRDKRKGWTYQATYGGRLVENIIQAICRDLLAAAMVRVDAAGYNIVLHVHDEIVAEVRENDETRSLDKMLALMSVKPKWAGEYPISAAGYEGYRYTKE